MLIRQRLTWFLILSIAVVFAGGASLAGIALAEPFVPGDLLYPVQDWAASLRLQTIRDPAALADWLLDDFDQHVADLEARSGQDVEGAILAAADLALDRAVVAVDAAPDDARGRLRQRLSMSVAHYEEVLRSLKVVPGTDPRAYAAAVMKAHAIVAAVVADRSGTAPRPIGEALRRIVNTGAGPATTPTAVQCFICSA